MHKVFTLPFPGLNVPKAVWQWSISCPELGTHPSLSLSNTFWENERVLPCLQGEENALWQWDTRKKHRDGTLLLSIQNIFSVVKVHRKFLCSVKYSRLEKKKRTREAERTLRGHLIYPSVPRENYTLLHHFCQTFPISPKHL